MATQSRRLNSSTNSKATSKPATTTSAKKTSEVDELKKQIEELRKLVEGSTKAENEVVQDDDFVNDDELKISGDDYIKVMSLCPYVLNLTTELKGKGKIFTFQKFGEVKRILYNDLVKILEVHPRFANEGLFIIMNSKVVRRHGLDESYDNILTKENIEKILSGNQSDAVNLFKIANPKQKEMIATIIIDRMVGGLEMDLNLVDRLSREMDYNIANRVNEIKEMQESMKSENN
jgi:hypothetical protein